MQVRCLAERDLEQSEGMNELAVNVLDVLQQLDGKFDLRGLLASSMSLGLSLIPCFPALCSTTLSTRHPCCCVLYNLFPALLHLLRKALTSIIECVATPSRPRLGMQYRWSEGILQTSEGCKGIDIVRKVGHNFSDKSVGAGPQWPTISRLRCMNSSDDTLGHEFDLAVELLSRGRLSA